MTWYTWVIIALLIISFYQYSNPAKANEMLKSVWGPVDSFITKNNPIGNNSLSDAAVTCPTTDEPVCGDGTTYKNSCFAALEGILEVTPGSC